MSPLLFRTRSRRTSPGSMRKGMSAWALTCHVRPKRLKSLMYSPPMLTWRASKTSLSGSPIDLHLVRLTSTNSRGVFARNTLNSPTSPGWLLPAAIRASVCAWIASKPSPPRSSIMIRKPPVLPRPRIGGDPNTPTIASSTSAASRWRMFFMIASADSSGERRFSNGSRTTNMLPRCEPLAWSTNDMPAVRSVWATPGVERMTWSTRAIASSVRLSEAESGSCTTA